MRVDQARCCGQPFQVDDPGILSDQPANGFACANRGDLVALDRDGFGDGIVRIDGDNPSVDEDQIGRERQDRALRIFCASARARSTARARAPGSREFGAFIRLLLIHSAQLFPLLKIRDNQRSFGTLIDNFAAE